MDDEHSICTALLHDVIEDAGITPEYLRQEGFPQEVIDALLCLTHDKDVPYLDYIADVKKNRMARKVKLADLKHNSNISRFDNPSEEDYSRVEKYKTAIKLIMK